jgi:hypothetical protein
VVSFLAYLTFFFVDHEGNSTIFREANGFKKLSEYISKFYQNEELFGQLFNMLSNLIDFNVKNRRAFHESGGSNFLISLLKLKEFDKCWQKHRVFNVLEVLITKNIPRQREILLNNTSFFISFYKKEKDNFIKSKLRRMLLPFKIKAFDKIVDKEGTRYKTEF